MIIKKSYITTLIKLGIAGALIVIFDKLIIAILFQEWIRNILAIVLIIYVAIHYQVIAKVMKKVYEEVRATKTKRGCVVKIGFPTSVISIGVWNLSNIFDFYATLSIVDKLIYSAPDLCLLLICTYLWINKKTIIPNVMKFTKTLCGKMTSTTVGATIMASVITTFGIVQLLDSQQTEQIAADDDPIAIADKSQESLIVLSEYGLDEFDDNYAIAKMEHYFNNHDFSGIDLVFFYVMAIVFLTAIPFVLLRKFKGSSE